MPRRPATTVLLLTRHLIGRADFARDHALRELWTQPRPDVHDWPALVEIALALGPKPGRITYVLCSDLWTQTLSLTNISTKTMGPDELAGALNFEAEALSGQSAFESAVAVQALPAANEYWLVQPRIADFAQAEQIVQQAGSRLAGLTHPGGLPLPVSAAERPAIWTRIEFWPDAVLLLRGDAQGKTLVQVLNADPQTGRWKANWEAWRQEAGNTPIQEALIGPGMSAAAGNVGNALALDKDADLSPWLTAWARHLQGKTAAVPLLRPARKPMGTGQRWAIAVALVAAMLLGCGSLHYWLDKNLRVVSAELQQIQAQKKQFDDTQKQIDELKGKQKDLHGQMDGLETSLKVLATHRQRLSRFLAKLSDLYPEHLYVEKIDIETGEPRLRGHCLTPELADQFANQLALALADQGWEVQSPKKAALKVAVNGAPWSFDIQLKSAKEMTLETRVETKKGRGK